MILIVGGAAAPLVLQQIDRRSENSTRLKPKYKIWAHTRIMCVDDRQIQLTTFILTTNWIFCKMS